MYKSPILVLHYHVRDITIQCEAVTQKFLTRSIHAVIFPKMCQNTVISKENQNFQTSKYKMKKGYIH